MALKVGPYLSIIGGLILIIYRIIIMTNEFLGSTSLASAVILAKTIQLVFVIIWGGLIILGAFLVLRNKLIGKYLALVGGIGAIIGLFINIPFNDGTPVPYYQNLSSTFFFIDIALMLIGAILMIIKNK
jgi:hypothetical protein